MKENRKSRLTQKMWAKVSAFILLIITLAVTVLGVIAAALMLDYGIYITAKDEFKEETYYCSETPNELWILYRYYDLAYEGLKYAAEEYLLAYIKIENETTGKLIAEYGEENYDYRTETDSFTCDIYSDDGESYVRGDKITVTTHYDFSPEKLKNNEYYYFIDKVIDLVYVMRYWIYPIIIAALCISISLFVFLMCSSGRRFDSDEIHTGWGTKIPFDLLLAGWIVGASVLLIYAFDSWYWNYYEQIIFSVLALLVCTVSFIGLCMSFALRVKLGEWWKNTLIYYCLMLLRKLLCKIKKLFILGGRMLMKIPLIWKSALMIAGYTALEFILLCFNLYEGDNMLILWIIKTVILVPSVIYIALSLKKLQDGGQKIAEGKIANHIDTKYLIGDFKAHGENLNRIGEGINIAVEERMKSERMKTELITNVSHDIKTPLTSIINYSDLIAKEPTDNEKISEYSSVLLRQSERLKRLIDDLVEASKASTGNLEIIPAPFDLGVLFAQTAGEYEERLIEKELTLITRQPEDTLYIMADGRRIWRIFDNLMNNICKYAQGGTRVYLTLEECENNAVISFKNTSREELNMSADELMERFTRGDSSRNTEGNGLGLSIAKSLCELQNGKMDITVDGDLFKVVLKFPLI